LPYNTLEWGRIAAECAPQDAGYAERYREFKSRPLRQEQFL